ncbi:MAG: cation diffusion facilitator family transporter [Desulfurivibrionaceae bacterium]|nr:cation diffusion facilitator family transporter [Desulfobulbales bacterium]MDT8335686.1 cation diffusion facilitator family transporter [Desulfurivibrionaceae bacterium]
MAQAAKTTAGDARLVRLASIVSVAVALALVLVKAWVWLLSGSLSVLASLADSMLDGAASLINLLAIRYSQKSADSDHPFGHGKAEYLAGLGQSLFIAGSALFILVQALRRIVEPHPLDVTGLSVGVMIFAVLLTAALVLFQQKVVARTGSMAIKADSLHYSADLFTNLGTVLALALAAAGWAVLDPLIAVVIALVVLYNAWRIGHDSTQFLLDCKLPPELEARIFAIAMANRGVEGVHDIKTRRSGQTEIIQLHLEMKGSMPLAESHRIAKEVENDIRKTVPAADIIIHQDPIAGRE